MGDFYCLGVDFGTQKISIALRGPQTLRVTTKDIGPGLPLDQSMRALGVSTDALFDWCTRPLKHGILYPDLACAIVEQPGGSNTKRLHMAQGVIFERIALKNVAAIDVPVGTWRKEILGNGGLRRAEAKKQAIAFAKTLGYTGDSDDEAEAICLAEYGIRTVTIGP